MSAETEAAAFRGEMKAHMKNTASGIHDIRADARRQAEATAGLREEVTSGFSAVSDRVTRVEAAHEAHTAGHAAPANGTPTRNGRRIAIFGTSGLGLGALFAEVVRAFRGG